jgi:hypothetical protein
MLDVGCQPRIAMLQRSEALALSAPGDFAFPAVFFQCPTTCTSSSSFESNSFWRRPPSETLSLRQPAAHICPRPNRRRITYHGRDGDLLLAPPSPAPVFPSSRHHIPIPLRSITVNHLSPSSQSYGEPATSREAGLSGKRYHHAASRGPSFQRLRVVRRLQSEVAARHPSCPGHHALVGSQILAEEGLGWCGGRPYHYHCHRCSRWRHPGPEQCVP